MQEKTAKPLIGIITASASLSEQRQLLGGIIEQAQKFGAATAIFSNIYNSAEYFAEVEVENKIYDLIISEKLSGLILTAESFLNDDIRTYIYERLASRTEIPIVVTGGRIGEYVMVDNDVRADIEDMVNHLVQVHGFTDIDFLTGHEGLETSEQRVAGYRAALEAGGIRFDENKIIYGDFWMTSGEKLAMEYVQGTRRLPQAVVCANDYMAYGLCDVFLEHGIAVPEEVSVIGYEYIGERYFHAPILTTYQRNRKVIGQQAVNILWEMMTGKKQEPVSLRGYIVGGNTCTCGTNQKLLHNELSTIRREQFYSTLNLVGNFEQQLTVCRSIHDFINVLQQFAYLIRDISGLHLCLYENWCSSEISGGTSRETQTMVYHTVIAEKHVVNEPVYYHKYDLFPEELLQAESGDVLYFCPIFFSGRELGYFIVQYMKPDCYDIIFRDWLKIAANALEILRMKNDIGTLLECRNLSEFHDSITGLYNEQGLRNELERPLKHAAPEMSVMLLLVRSELFSYHGSLDEQELSVHMDLEVSENLKKIAVQRDTFCAKFSDKLYVVAAVGRYTEQTAALWTDKLQTLIGHAPLYSEHCGVDSLYVLGKCFPAEGFDLTSAYTVLVKAMQQRISRLTEKRRHPNFKEYTALRNALHRMPQKNWDAQQSCRSFHLSYGYFRAAYKELFGISFHQDVIRSRISLAKFLLLTTALSLPAIAGKCGYEDDKYFLRQFRQLTGMTPNAYRSSHPE